MSILKVKSLFFYKNHEIKLKRFCINIELRCKQTGEIFKQLRRCCKHEFDQLDADQINKSVLCLRRK